MILVPNRPQLLSGSKISILGFFVILLFAASCGGGKTKTPPSEIVTPEGVKIYNPTTGRYEFPAETMGKMDTVKWTEANPTTNDPIQSDPTQYKEKEEEVDPNVDPTYPDGLGLLSTYNVAIMMPFNSNQVNQLEGGIHSSSYSTLHFYEGVKMALDKLSNEGANFKVTVMDTKRSESETERLLRRSEVQDAHLIIGPYSSKTLTKVADFSKSRKVALVSPVNTSSKITSQNKYYMQANPSLRSHCEAITKHALKSYSADQIVLVVRQKDAEIKRLKYFQETHQDIAGDANVTPFREFVIDATVAEEFGELDLVPYINEGRPTVFIVPSYSNETFISNFMRQVELVKGRNEVIVYGMPRWMEYERTSYEYYERLKLHVSSSTFVNKEDQAIKDFTRQFFERYGCLPGENAYVGYDQTLFFGRQLQKYGLNMVNNIDAQFEQYLTTKFEFEKYISEEDAVNERFDKVNYLENKYINILKFENYRFQKAD